MTKRTKRILSVLTAGIITMTTFASCAADGEMEDAYNGTKDVNGGQSYINSNQQAADGSAQAPTDMEMNVAEDAIMAEADDYYPNTEEYNPIVENAFINADTENLSTFSIDVDTASYSNFRRMLLNGQQIDRNAIRIEEFINYFDYDYPEPEGDIPFSVNVEYSDCPWNEETKLVMIGLQAEKIDMTERAPMNVVFLIDVSGSMYDPNKLPLVQQSFDMLAESLNENDTVSIVTYAGEDKVILRGAKGSDYKTISDALYSLTAGGSTAGAAGINTAYEIAQEYFIEGGNNRVILATDGDLNVGVSSEEGLTRLIEEKRDSGIFLSVLGFGYGNYKDNKLEALADNGNGNYAYIDSEFEAKRVLVEEMGSTLYTVAKDVKIQVDFNAENVLSYRLVGYENRLLANEDFIDDTKDAGEIGAGHSVTALYEIIPAPGFDSDNVKGRLLTVSVRHKAPDSDTSTQYDTEFSADSYTTAPSDNFVFASNIAGFAMAIRESEYNKSFSIDNFKSILNEMDIDGDLYKEELRDIILPKF